MGRGWRRRTTTTNDSAILHGVVVYQIVGVSVCNLVVRGHVVS